MNQILVTGANGFIGQRLCAYLAARDFKVKAAVRNQSCAVPSVSEADKLVLGSLEDWNISTEMFANVDTVIHLASRVHMMRETALDPLTAYRKVNVEATKSLAKIAALAGVRRFIFLSSVKVNGESTSAEQKFCESDVPNPQDPYGQSKWEAEQGLWEISKRTGLEVVVLRPALVYGKGVRANFQKLLQLIESGWPIPLGLVDNKRSLIFVENCVDAIAACIYAKNACNQTFLLSDGEDVSTAELIRRLATALHRPERLLPVSPKLLRLAGYLTGKQENMRRLLDSLRVDNRKICLDLNWRPPFTMQAAFQKDFSSDHAHS